MTHYDVFIIGSGVGGGTVAAGLAAEGKKVGVADRSPFGGTCALRGCQPKKVLVVDTEVSRHSQKLLGKGIREAARNNWKELIHFKRQFTDPIPKATIDGFQEQGIDTYQAEARFTGGNTLLVGDTEISADTIVVGSGARSRPLSIPGADLAHDSDHFLDMESLPERIIFIGGGYISFEFAHVAAAAGSKPVILHRSKDPLKQFEPDLVQAVVESSEAEGIRVITEAPGQEIKRQIDGFQVVTPSGPVDGDLVIAAAGRIPNIDALNLEAAGIEASKHGIHVNGYMQSPSNPRVYALGDSAAKRYPLSPVAIREAETTIENILNGNTVTMDYSVVPSVVFTHPPLAAVGLTEDEAAGAGMDVEVHTGDMSGWASSKRLGESYGRYKVLIHKSTGMIAGAHIFAPRASESINIFALAMKYEISADDLKRTMFAYPTYVSEITSMLG